MLQDGCLTKMNFPCIQCGLCCRTLSNVLKGGNLDRGDGVCKYLQGNLCGIYNTRPVFCNVEAVYFSTFKKIMGEIEFVVLNLKSCIKIAEVNKEKDIKTKLEMILRKFCA
jgi:Fe-S-cluster containining protein